jgi:hypothetical protein
MKTGGILIPIVVFCIFILVGTPIACLLIIIVRRAD